LTSRLRSSPFSSASRSASSPRILAYYRALRLRAGVTAALRQAKAIGCEIDLKHAIFFSARDAVVANPAHNVAGRARLLLPLDRASDSIPGPAGRLRIVFRGFPTPNHHDRRSRRSSRSADTQGSVASLRHRSDRGCCAPMASGHAAPAKDEISEYRKLEPNVQGIGRQCEMDGGKSRTTYPSSDPRSVTAVEEEPNPENEHRQTLRVETVMEQPTPSPLQVAMSFNRILKGAGHGHVLGFCRHYEATFHRL
jgi:hypothetical protein